MKPLRITVEPSDSHPDVLDICDAMQQVLDFFSLLSDQANENIVWNLTLASTNSPLTVEGEPVDLRTHASAYSAVESHVRTIERAFHRIVSGDPLDSDFPTDKLRYAEQILERTLNGIGRTACDFGRDEATVEIEAQIAERSLQVIRGKPDDLYNYFFGTFSRRESGSIEGRIIDVGTHYDKPAIHVREHSSRRDIWCQVDDQVLEEIEMRITAGDVWHRRRVKVNGELSYDADGRLTRIVGSRISYMEPRDVSIDDIHDPDFTEGISPQEYLEKIRENDFE